MTIAQGSSSGRTIFVSPKERCPVCCVSYCVLFILAPQPMCRLKGWFYIFGSEKYPKNPFARMINKLFVLSCRSFDFKAMRKPCCLAC